MKGKGETQEISDWSNNYRSTCQILVDFLFSVGFYLLALWFVFFFRVFLLKLWATLSLYLHDFFFISLYCIISFASYNSFYFVVEQKNEQTIDGKQWDEKVGFVQDTCV